MPRTHVEITTPDGIAPASIVRPDGTGPWPGVLMFMDAIGMRPAMIEIAEQIASRGYVVLLPDLFYRSGPYVAPAMSAFFADPATRTAWMTNHVAKANTLPDVPAYLDYLAAQPDVAP
jgi:carboxymethylenebutenolidase